MQGQNSNRVQVLLLWSKLQTSCKHGDGQKEEKVGMKHLSAPKLVVNGNRFVILFFLDLVCFSFPSSDQVWVLLY
jgi:hypothetical protein